MYSVFLVLFWQILYYEVVSTTQSDFLPYAQFDIIFNFQGKIVMSSLLSLRVKVSFQKQTFSSFSKIMFPKCFIQIHVKDKKKKKRLGWASWWTLTGRNERGGWSQYEGCGAHELGWPVWSPSRFLTQSVQVLSWWLKVGVVASRRAPTM